MKYIKLLMLIVAVSFFASCSDDDDYNTQEGVTVGFESDNLVFSEGAGLQEIPVVVNGKHRNGDIHFRIQLETVEGLEAAEQDSMYYITGYDFNIPADSLVDRVNVEIVFINDRIPADARHFRINIVDLKGAEPGIASTVVRIDDNDGDAYTYESLFGQYNFDFDFIFDKQKYPNQAVTNMSGASNQEDGRYNKELLLTGVGNLGPLGPQKLAMPMVYSYDIDAAAGQIGFIMNRKILTLESNGGKNLDIVFINSENGMEKEPIMVDFTMEKAQLKDANGNPILDKNGNPVMYNKPATMKFDRKARAMMFNVTGTPEEQGGIGLVNFHSLVYLD